MKHRILVVDDTPANVRLLEAVLRQDFDTVAAIDGPSALQLATTEPTPELILLDVMMPGMDGFQVCSHLKSNPATSSIPIIFVTALTDAADEARGLAVGAVDYVTKPINPPIVKARIRTHLALYHQSRTLEDQVRIRTRELRETQHALLHCLGRAAEFRDNETGLHTIRVSHYVRALAVAAKLPSAQAELLFHAAPLHDIGKIGIPDGVLLKAGKLDEIEWQLMRQHPTIGSQIIGEQTSEILRMARVIAETHHEKWDGSGYPNGLKGNSIPLPGRLVAIADVFDALTSERPYKKPWTVESAVDLITTQSEKHFDPELVERFLEVRSEFTAIRDTYSDRSALHRPERPRELAA
jgi:putative two-component system response regulator